MLPSLSCGLRLALALVVSVGYVARNSAIAYAADDDEEDDGGGDDEGGDGEGAEGGDDGEGDDDKDQPAVTAGGLFTMRTFPIRELERPLTITQKITQARLGLGTDVSNKGAFESVGLSIEALHGYTDNFMLLGGVTSSYNFQQFNIYGGFEGALAYDLLDIRLAASLRRFVGGDSDPDPGKVDYRGGATKFSVDIGFPFRYVAKPEVAIIALNTLMSIDFNGDAKEMTVDDGMGGTITTKTGNGTKPDLNPSLGIATNPVAPLSVVLFATLQVVDFDFSDKLKVPATARVQYSPNRKLDLGLEFTFLNMKPADGEKFYDNRFLSLFFATRVGK